jgi:hypothetical protein
MTISLQQTVKKLRISFYIADNIFTLLPEGDGARGGGDADHLNLLGVVEVISGPENLISPCMTDYDIGILLYLKNTFERNRTGDRSRWDFGTNCCRFWRRDYERRRRT